MAENGKMQSKGGNQNVCTLKCNKTSILVWRRAFAIRYFLKLGENANYLVKWNDFDEKANNLTINDESKIFDWKLPHPKLNKTTVTVSFSNKKLFVITLYYTTNTILVQGQKTGQWEKYEKISIAESVAQFVDNRAKGRNSFGHMDSKFKNIPFNDTWLTDSEENTGTSVVHVKEENNENNEKETSENEKGIQRDESTADSKSKQKIDVEKCKHDGKETNKSEKDDLTGLQNKIREQTEDIDNIKTVLHRIEQECTR